MDNFNGTVLSVFSEHTKTKVVFPTERAKTTVDSMNRARSLTIFDHLATRLQKINKGSVSPSKDKLTLITDIPIEEIESALEKLISLVPLGSTKEDWEIMKKTLTSFRNWTDEDWNKVLCIS